MLPKCRPPETVVIKGDWCSEMALVIPQGPFRRRLLNGPAYCPVSEAANTL
jgi:hypothetical protein